MIAGLCNGFTATSVQTCRTYLVKVHRELDFRATTSHQLMLQYKTNACSKFEDASSRRCRDNDFTRTGKTNVSTDRQLEHIKPPAIGIANVEAYKEL